MSVSQEAAGAPRPSWIFMSKPTTTSHRFIFLFIYPPWLSGACLASPSLTPTPSYEGSKWVPPPVPVPCQLPPPHFKVGGGGGAWPVPGGADPGARPRGRCPPWTPPTPWCAYRLGGSGGGDAAGKTDPHRPQGDRRTPWGSSGGTGAPRQTANEIHSREAPRAFGACAPPSVRRSGCPSVRNAVASIPLGESHIVIRNDVTSRADPPGKTPVVCVHWRRYPRLVLL